MKIKLLFVMLLLFNHDCLSNESIHNTNDKLDIHFYNDEKNKNDLYDNFNDLESYCFDLSKNELDCKMKNDNRTYFQIDFNLLKF